MKEGQGNRVLTKEHLEEIVLDPSGFMPFTLDAPFKGGFLFQQVEGNLAQHSQVLGTMILADTALIFSKGNVQGPMQAVFDTPVSTGGLQQGLGLAGQTADVVAGLDTGPRSRLPLGRHLNHGVELCPLLPVLEIVQAVWVRDDPALAGLEAAMVLVHRAGEVIGDALEVEFLCPLEEVANVFVQLALILLYRQSAEGGSAWASMISRAIPFWQPMASMVTMHPARSSSCSSLGMAVISLDFSSTLAWPSTKPLAEAHTLTMWMACLPRVRSWERRTVLPSMATTSPWVTWATAWTHSMKQRWNWSGSNRAKTSPKVSWEGMPLGNSKKDLNHSSLSFGGRTEELEIQPVISAADGATNSNGDDIQEVVPLGAVGPKPNPK